MIKKIIIIKTILFFRNIYLDLSGYFLTFATCRDTYYFKKRFTCKWLVEINFMLFSLLKNYSVVVFF